MLTNKMRTTIRRLLTDNHPEYSLEQKDKIVDFIQSDYEETHSKWVISEGEREKLEHDVYLELFQLMEKGYACPSWSDEKNEVIYGLTKMGERVLEEDSLTE